MRQTDEVPLTKGVPLACGEPVRKWVQQSLIARTVAKRCTVCPDRGGSPFKGNQNSIWSVARTVVTISLGVMTNETNRFLRGEVFRWHDGVGCFSPFGKLTPASNTLCFDAIPTLILAFFNGARTGYKNYGKPQLRL